MNKYISEAEIAQLYDWLDKGLIGKEDVFWMFQRKWGSQAAREFVEALVGIEE